MVDALEGLRVRFVEEAELRAADAGLRSFVNVNTPGELAAARALAAAGEAVTAPHPRARTRAARLWRDGVLSAVEVPVVREIPVTLRLNGREIITLLASDDALDFLAAGFLKAEGFVSRREDIVAIRVDPQGGDGGRGGDRGRPARGETARAAGRHLRLRQGDDVHARARRPPGPAGAGRPAGERRPDPPADARAAARLGPLPGGRRRCTAPRSRPPAEIVIFRDDIGRHNAVDKIHGECFLRDIPVADKILLTTGRISSEILVKAAKLGVAILVSRSSPTDLALELAGRTGITVVGQVRGGGLTIYTGEERVSA